MKALTFSAFGGPEVLEYCDVADPLPSAGEALVAMKAIGLNFADVYRRQGNYHLKGEPPYINGYEGSGVVVDAGGITGVRVGDRVAFADVPFAQAEVVRVPFAHLIPLPPEISFETAAGILLQGLTAQYLCEDSYPVQAGDIVVIHAASGGVGQLLTQMAKKKKARVIGLTTRDARVSQIIENGADVVFNIREDWVNRVLAFSGGRGANVVYDSVGNTLEDSINTVRDGGVVVFYGFSGGDPPLISPRKLMDGSKTITGGDLWTYLSDRGERINRSGRVFRSVINGDLRVPQPSVYSLQDGKRAYTMLETGAHAGKILFVP